MTEAALARPSSGVASILRGTRRAGAARGAEWLVGSNACRVGLPHILSGPRRLPEISQSRHVAANS